MQVGEEFGLKQLWYLEESGEEVALGSAGREE